MTRSARVILGIAEAHDASACLMIDGQIVAAAQEERFTGMKGDYGPPVHAANACLKAAGLTIADVDEIAIASHGWHPVTTKMKRNANFSVKDWIEEQNKYWKPKIYEGKNPSYWDIFKDRNGFIYNEFYDVDEKYLDYALDDETMESLWPLRRDALVKALGASPEKMRTVSHEDCHRFYAYFASPMRGDVLALTAEGLGDYSNGTVSVMSEKGCKELAFSRENRIGNIYQYITLMLGMKPGEHEYKVMGLAPYANSRELQKSYEVFRNILKVDGLKVVFDQRPKDLYFHFRDALEGHRFDGIAGAVQLFAETVLTRWVQAAVRETGLNRIVFAGGVSQNIKACKAILELPEVSDMFVAPAAGDASLSIGACYTAMQEYTAREGLDPAMIQPMSHAYLGPDVTDAEVTKYLQDNNIAQQYEIIENISPDAIAARLESGQVIARCAGRMEFGQRALGNRSINCDPRHPGAIDKINRAIKYRDFWMPFTPSILPERMNDYVLNPKGAAAPFMTMAFESTPLGQEHLPAALHPADHTARPQAVNPDHNPGYYDLIKAFEKRTGVGAILNTSFNLHGEPIVLGPKQAIHTLDNSDLDGVTLGSCLVARHRADA